MEREEKLGIAVLLGLFIAISAYLLSQPYDPQRDIVDGVAVDDWGHLLLEGRWQLPLEEWMDRGFRGHQSGLVQRDDGVIYVVPEKGIGYCLLYAAFLALGVQQLLGVMLLGVALLATYYLARTLVGPRAALVSGVFLLTSATALIMTFRYAWVDLGTMSLMAAGFALFLADQRLREVPPGQKRPRFRGPKLALALGVLSGAVFGWAVATRYVMGVAVVAPLLCVAAAEGRGLLTPRGMLRGLRRVLPFAVGLLAVLAPLMYFNTVAYGGPFMSGYDVYRLSDFFATYHGPLENATLGQDPITSADFVIISDIPNTVWKTAVQFAAGMPCFFFAWFGLWRLRRGRAALALLGGWFLSVYLAYLTVGHLGDIGLRGLQESRYFLPMLPACAVLAGAALHFPRWRQARQWVLVVALLAVLLTVGLYFASENISRYGGWSRPDQPPPPITLAQLYARPQDYTDRMVHVVGLTVVKVVPAGYVAEANATNGTAPPPRILLVCRNCTGPPNVTLGTRLDALGVFHWDDRDHDGVYDPQEDRLDVVELLRPGARPRWPPSPNQGSSPAGNQSPGQPAPPPTPTPPPPISLAQLYAAPGAYANRTVYVVGLTIERRVQPGYVANASGGNGTLRLLLAWPQNATPPDVSPGTPVDVLGVFRWNDRDRDGVYDPQEDRLELLQMLAPGTPPTWPLPP